MAGVTVNRVPDDAKSAVAEAPKPEPKVVESKVQRPPLAFLPDPVVWEYRPDGFYNVATGELCESLFVRIHSGHPIRTLRGEESQRTCWSEDGEVPVHAAALSRPTCAGCPHVSEKKAYEDFHKAAITNPDRGDISAILEAYKGDCRFEYILKWKEQFLVSGGQFGPDRDAPPESVLILPKASVLAMWDDREPSSYKRRLAQSGLDFKDVVTRIYMDGMWPNFDALVSLVRPKVTQVNAPVPDAKAPPATPPGAAPAVEAALTATLSPAGPPVVTAEPLPEPVPQPPAPEPGSRADLAQRIAKMDSSIKDIVYGVLGVDDIAKIPDAELGKVKCVVEEAEKQS